AMQRFAMDEESQDGYHQQSTSSAHLRQSAPSASSLPSKQLNMRMPTPAKSSEGWMGMLSWGRGRRRSYESVASGLQELYKACAGAAAETDAGAAARPSQAAAEAELRGRLRQDRFAHDGLLRQLRQAAAAGQLDPVDWRRLRAELTEAAPQLRPAEVPMVLGGLATLRSVEPAYLSPVLQPIGHLAPFMSGPQLVAALSGLSALAPPAADGGIADPALGVVQQQSDLMFGLVEARLGSLSHEDMLQLLEAVLHLQCHQADLLETIISHLPSPTGLPTSRLQRLLLTLQGLLREAWVGETCVAGIRTVLLDCRTAVRTRLRTLSDQELLQVLLLSVGVERALSALHAEQAALRRDEPGVDLGPGELLLLAGEGRLRTAGSAAGFHRLLLGQLGSPHSVLAEMKPRECVELARALAALSAAERAEQPAAVRAWPPPYLARLCPSLVERVLEVLDILRADELLSILEGLSLDLGYRDHYFADRCAEALRPRLVPVRDTPHGQASPAIRALQVLALHGPVGFATLLVAVLEDLGARAEAGLELNVAPCAGLRELVEAGRACAAAGAEEPGLAGAGTAWLFRLSERFGDAAGDERSPSSRGR
ncbi:unnamed protein product, partial [Prorocentrum cordatum]